MSFSKFLFNLTIILPAFLIITNYRADAQVFQQLNETNGLPINLVSDIIQDDYGFMWIATEAGLVRFDGSQTKVFLHHANDSTSISNNAPVKLAKAENGDIWIASNEGLLDRYRMDTDQFERYELSSISTLPDSRVYDIYPDSNVIWLGVESGLVRYHSLTGQTDKYFLSDLMEDKPKGQNTVFDIAQDPENEEWLWLFTHIGLLRLDKKTTKVRYFAQDMQKSGDLPALISGLVENTMVWAGNSRYGLRAFDLQNNEWTYYIDNELKDPAGFNGISRMAQKSPDAFWIASRTRGFGAFNRLNKKYQYFQNDGTNPYSIQDGELSTLFIDADKNIWLGGAHGVSFYNPSFQRFQKIDLPERTISHDKTHNFPSSAIPINDSTLLIGTVSGNGLYLSHLRSGQTELIAQYQNADYSKLEQEAIAKKKFSLDVFDLLKVSQDKIWVAMNHQLAYYDIPKKILVFPTTTQNSFFQNKTFRDLNLDHEGYMWGLNRTDNTLFKCDKISGELLEKVETKHLVESKLKDSNSYGIHNYAIHPDGNIWMISFQDVIIYNPNSKGFEVLPRKEGNLPGTEGKGFYNIDFDQQGNAYIASSLNGLQIIRPMEENLNDRYQLLTVANGLPVSKVIRVKCSKQFVWITTRKGLVRYTPATGKVRVFDRSDGIPNIDLLNYWQPSLDVSDNGMILFGNPDKLIWFYEDSLYHNLRPPEILISSLETHSGKNQSFGNPTTNDKIKLAADQNFFSVQFGMDDFTQPQRQVYRYRLAGYDNDWVNAGKSRIANYTKVPSGDYIFEIEGANSSGTWSAQPARIPLEIATPFIQSNFFYALVVASMITLLYLAYRYQIIQIREKNKIRSDLNVKLAEAEMRALRAQMNPHFVFNCLNSINKFIITNDARTASRYLTKFSKLMRLILNNSRKKTIPLEDELEALQLYIEMEQLRSSQGFDFSCDLHLKTNPKSILIPSMLIQPFAENAIWHGLMPLEKKGHISLMIKEEDDLLFYVIDDNGIGRKRAADIKARQEVKRDSKGMQITKDRIRLNDLSQKTKSNIEIEDKVDEMGRPAGTKVTIKIYIQHIQPAIETMHPK